MIETLIEYSSVCKTYKTGGQTTVALDSVSLSVARNESVLIRGRSGAGKSTLLQVMSGLIRPDSGRVVISGRVITDMDSVAISRMLLDDVGFIFQNFNLLPSYTVYENIEISLVPKGIDRRVIKDEIMALLQKFGLYGKANQMPSALSIGQQQLVAVIRTIARKPSIIFADEPTGSVDDQTAAEILGHLMMMKKENKATLVMATHGTLAETVADRVYYIENGRVKN